MESHHAAKPHVIKKDLDGDRAMHSPTIKQTTIDNTTWGLELYLNAWISSASVAKSPLMGRSM